MNPRDLLDFRKNPLLVPALAGILLVVGFAIAVGAPIVSGDLSTLNAFAAPSSEQALSGRTVYLAEGCVYCHTQQVRAVSNDLGLGIVTRSDRIVRDDPALVGYSRVGPDLACYGDRALETGKLTAFMADPNSQFAFNRMPSYGSLSDSDLQDLAVYLASLTCGGKK